MNYILSLLDSVIALAKNTAVEISYIYNTHKQNYHVRTKHDKSPITIADKYAHKLIYENLSKLTPDIPIISEEGVILPYKIRKTWDCYWLIDPLDGTKEFIEQTDEFSINIAFIQNKRPLLGVVAVPMANAIYFATINHGAYYQLDNQPPKKIMVQPYNRNNIRIAVSKRHNRQAKLKQFLQQLSIPYSLLVCGSTLKMCLIANGIADCYPRFGSTYEWDTAAGQCILEAAGGKVLKIHNKKESIIYNDKSSLINPEFIAISDVRWLNDIILNQS